VIFKVTKKQGICVKDLYYKIYKHLEDGSYYRVNVKIVTFTLFYCYF
jgi:hypothetical protein